MKNSTAEERELIAQLKLSLSEEFKLQSDGMTGKVISNLISIPESKISSIRNCPESLSIEFLNVALWRLKNEKERVANQRKTS